MSEWVTEWLPRLLCSWRGCVWPWATPLGSTPPTCTQSNSARSIPAHQNTPRAGGGEMSVLHFCSSASPYTAPTASTTTYTALRTSLPAMIINNHPPQTPAPTRAFGGAVHQGCSSAASRTNSTNIWHRNIHISVAKYSSQRCQPCTLHPAPSRANDGITSNGCSSASLSHSTNS